LGGETVRGVAAARVSNAIAGAGDSRGLRRRKWVKQHDMTGHELLVSRYEPRTVLGIGGMAEVRDGWDTRLNRAVAIKLLHPTLISQPDVRRRFEDEARSAAALSHPNIVAVYDYGEHDGTPFIVMERLPGQTLGDVIEEGPLPPHRVHAMLADVLAALRVAHGAGVLHRDIKPGNILLSSTGDSMKVADFGIAKTDGAAHTLTGQIVGTLSYMSPERVTGAPASVADDLYAVAVMAYEALLACRAFPQDNPAALARAIVNDPPPPLTVVRPDLDPTLTTVVDRAMSRDPGQRFHTAEQMLAVLGGDRNALFGGAPIATASRPVTRLFDDPTTRHVAVLPPPPRKALSGNRKYAAAAAVLCAFAVSASALAMDPFSAPVTSTSKVTTSTPGPEPVSAGTAVPIPRTMPPPVPAVAPVTQQSEREPERTVATSNEEVGVTKNVGGGKGKPGHGKGNKKRG
jgi:serine/threonine protein kinase, bacterial